MVVAASLNRPIGLSSKKNIALVLGGGGVKAAAFHVGVTIALRERQIPIDVYIGSSAGAFMGALLAEGHPPESLLQTLNLDPFSYTTNSGSSSQKKEASSLPFRPINYSDIFDIPPPQNWWNAWTSAQKQLHPSLQLALDEGGGAWGFNPDGDLFTGTGASSSSQSPSQPSSSSDSSSFWSSSPQKKNLRQERRTQLFKSMGAGPEAFMKWGIKWSGLCSTMGLEKYLHTEILSEDDFSKISKKLYIISSDLNSTQKVIFGPPLPEELRRGQSANYPFISPQHRLLSTARISQAVAASTSIPPVYKPYKLEATPTTPKLYLYDGEIVETQSTDLAYELGSDLIINSYIMHPYQMNPLVGSLHQYGIPMILTQAMYQCMHQKLQHFFEQEQRNEQLTQTLRSELQKLRLPEEIQEKILTHVHQKLNFRPEVDILNIRPRHQNYEIFFADHFSLNARVLRRITKVGYKSAKESLQRLIS